MGSLPERGNNWRSLALLTLKLLPGFPFLVLTTCLNLTPSARLSFHAVFSVAHLYKFSSPPCP